MINRRSFIREAITGLFNGRATGSTLYLSILKLPIGVSRRLTRLHNIATIGARDFWPEPRHFGAGITV